MDLNIVNPVKLLHLNKDELKSIDGGKVTRESSVFYDAVYSVTYLITRSEIFTKNFWVEWSDAIR